MALIERLNRSSQPLVKLVGDISEAVLHRSTGDGWTIGQVIEHLYFRERLLADRIGFFANGIDHLPPFDPATAQYPDATVDEWQRLRKNNVDRLRMLAQQIWDRGTHHPTLGSYSLAKEAEIVAAHTEEHIRQVEALLAPQP
jgi:hypothetical protein